MYNKKEIIRSIEQHIKENKDTLPASEIEFLEGIQSKLSQARAETEILKWVTELLKFITLCKDIF